MQERTKVSLRAYSYSLGPRVSVALSRGPSCRNPTGNHRFSRICAEHLPRGLEKTAESSPTICWRTETTSLGLIIPTMTGRLQTGFSQAESLRTRELKGWLYLSASQLVWTRTCLRGHREVQAGPSHSLCRTDFIWNMSLMVPPLRVSVQFNSVAQSSPTLCDPMDCSTPGLPIHHQFPEFTQTHVHWVGNAIQPSHPLSSPSPAFNLSQHRGLFKWVSSLHQMAKYWSFSFSPSSEYSGLTSFRIDWLDLLAVQGTLKSLLQHHSLKASVLRCSAFFMVQLSHPNMTTGKPKALTRQTFVGKVMPLLFICCPSLS